MTTNIEILKLKEQELHTKEQEVRDALEQLKQEVIPLAKKECIESIVSDLDTVFDFKGGMIDGKFIDVNKLAEEEVEQIDWDEQWNLALFHIEDEELINLDIEDYVKAVTGWRWDNEAMEWDWDDEAMWHIATVEIAAKLGLEVA